ncbi:MAG: hypothetical protein WCP93_01200 [Candidatus Berkelbacteria bacterium]
MMKVLFSYIFLQGFYFAGISTVVGMMVFFALAPWMELGLALGIAAGVASYVAVGYWEAK